MSLISSSIPNFVNGVSQQPYTLRLVSQGEVQENGLSTVSQGLKKRPPTQHLKKIQDTPLGNCFIHTINRDSTERYVAVVTNGDLKVYDIAGVEKTVNFPNGKGYLSAATPSEMFSAVTVADYTFFVNKSTNVATAATTTESRPFEALINVKTGNYGKTYKIFINGAQAATFTTADGSSGSHSTSISTDNIASQLFTDLTGNTALTQSLTWNAGNSYTLPSGYTQANTTSIEVRTATVSSTPGPITIVYGNWVTVNPTYSTTTNFSVSNNGTPLVWDGVTYDPQIRVTRTGAGSNPWNAVRYGSVIHIQSSVDFTIRSEDGFNNAGMVIIKKSLQKFSDLPANGGVDGFVVEITGTGSGESSSQPFDSYYVRYDADGSDGSAGVWKECPAPGILSALNASTMPHILVRESNGTFTFKQAVWDYRVVGDNTSNPFPSFVGRPIADVFFYRNRLGFLSDEAVIFSEAGEYFNFMRTTVTQLLDSDPIDVNASHTKVAILKHAVPFNKQLLMFSEQTQFIIEQNELLTPKTVGIKVATEFPCNVRAKPVAIGKNVYFASDKGAWTSVREYFADLNNLTNDAVDITAHIPEYIPTSVFKIAAAANEDIMVALSSGSPNSLYVYKFFFNGNEKLQSSWSKWTFGSETTVLNADFIGSDLYLVLNRPDGVFLEKCTVSLGDIGAGEPYLVHLDRKSQLVAGNVDYSAGHTVISQTAIGYTPSTGNYQIVVKSHPTLKAGEIFNVIWDGTTAKVLGNITGGTYTFGRKYMFSYELTTVALRQNLPTGGQKSDTEGRLQLRKISFNYDDAGLFNVKVTPQGRQTFTYTYSGKVLGQSSATINSYSISSGRFQVPVVSRNVGTKIVLENDSPLPCSFLSADWEGFFIKRSQAV